MSYGSAQHSEVLDEDSLIAGGPSVRVGKNDKYFRAAFLPYCRTFSSMGLKYKVGLSMGQEVPRISVVVSETPGGKATKE